jgi:hypothetical protein
MPTISGTVLDDAGDPAAGRVVRAYRRDTGELLGSTLAGTTYATLNPSDKAAISVLSNNNLTFTVSNNDATAGIYYMVRGTQGVSSGKWYWETAIFGAGSGGNTYYTSGALLRSDYALVSPNTSTYPGSTAISVGGPFHMSDVKTYQNAVGSAALGSATAAGTTRLLRHRLDMDAGTYEQALDGGSWVTVATGLTGTYFPSLMFREGTSGGAAGQSAAATANFGASAFSYEVPSGFNAGVFVLTGGAYTITTAHTGECNVICLDDAAGTVYNDLILRTTPV